MRMEENKALAPLTTLGPGGAARWFVEARSEQEVAEAAGWAGEHGVALFVLGGGSNLLVADGGFDGLVLHVALRGIEAATDPKEEGRVVYQAAAGEEWENLVQRATADGCAGVECLAGIPGTVGGTPVQNVGAYGQEVSSVISRVRAFDLLEHSCGCTRELLDGPPAAICQVLLERFNYANPALEALLEPVEGRMRPASAFARVRALHSAAEEIHHIVHKFSSEQSSSQAEKIHRV